MLLNHVLILLLAQVAGFAADLPGVMTDQDRLARLKAAKMPRFDEPLQFDTPKADLLVLIPPGYADTPPDMFYLLPWVRLVANNAYPRCADQPHQFAGQSWQRWSRHSTEWRPGIDGIWSMLKRVDHALNVAA